MEIDLGTLIFVIVMAAAAGGGWYAYKVIKRK
jgi:hypothetical protein